VLVNGAAWPRLEVERRKYRLRILNACNSTPLTLALNTDHDIVQIATDAGLLPAPVAVKQIPLAMAERAEVVIDFAKYRAGTRIVLQDREALEGRQGAGPSSELMCFDVIEARTVDTSSLPDRLATVDRIAPEAAVRTRDFEFAADLAPVWNFPPISWNINAPPPEPLGVSPQRDRQPVRAAVNNHGGCP
jgi:spore coat protein A, manganese oxidase